MCGRYVLTSPPDAIRTLFGYAAQPDFPARHNIAPTQPIAIVRMKEGRREFALVRWGLIPSWVKDPHAFSLLFNARGESVLDKPSFRNAMRRRRCLIPADGFYEWKGIGARKQPHFIRRKDGKPFAFAGLWESWMGPNGEEMETAAIVTTSANRDLAAVHERMPVIVTEEFFDMWLDCANVDEKTAATLIAPAPEGLYEAHPVSAAVNNVANDDTSLLKQVAEQADEPPKKPAPAEKPARKAAASKPKPDSGQGSLF